jgi:hypothetical protein
MTHSNTEEEFMMWQLRMDGPTKAKAMIMLEGKYVS